MRSVLYRYLFVNVRGMRTFNTNNIDIVNVYVILGVAGFAAV